MLKHVWDAGFAGKSVLWGQLPLRELRWLTPKGVLAVAAVFRSVRKELFLFGHPVHLLNIRQDLGEISGKILEKGH